MFLASLLRAIVAIRFTARPSPQRAPAAWQPSTPKGSSPKAPTDTEVSRLIQSCTDVESPLFQAHGKAVAQRNDRRYEFAGLVNHPVELLDRGCVAVAFLCRQRHSARPEYVVRDEQSSRAQPWQRQLKRLGILPLETSLKIRSNWPGVFLSDSSASPRRNSTRSITPASRRYRCARSMFAGSLSV